MHPVYVGTAGWTIPRALKDQFGNRPSKPEVDSLGTQVGAGSHLERYSRILTAVEINSSFYRPHRRSTYRRWAASTPPSFRFAVKAPREMTHNARLQSVDQMLVRFLGEARGLGDKLGPILFQLPPSLEFDARIATCFFELLRGLYDGPSVLEPRHQSWFEPGAEDLLKRFRIARVAADPPPQNAQRPPVADTPVSASSPGPGGWRSLAYFRLHGSPRMYYSAYCDQFLRDLSARIIALAQRGTVWCTFDNTAGGAATSNALTLLKNLAAARG